MPDNPESKIQPTSWLLLFAIFGVVGVTSFFVTDAWLGYGLAPVLVPAMTFLIPLFVAAFILWQGWRVRSYRQGRRMLNMLTAARIWLLSQAVSRTGAITSGVCAGIVASYAGYSHSNVMVSQAITIGLAGLASIAMAVAGLVAELWCKNDDEATPPGVTA